MAMTEAQKIAQAKYQASDKRKVTKNKYRKSAKGKATETKYRDSDRARMTQLRSYLRINYGLTVTQFNSMADAQGWVCGICGEVLEEANGKGKTLHVDHIHGTNHIRDLLCGGCNPGLGHFKDSPDLLRKAAAYLERHAAIHRMRESWPNLAE